MTSHHRPLLVTVGTAAALALGSLGLVAAVPAAQAGTCSSKTGGSSDTLIWTGSGYTCAYVASNGNNKISAWATESWTSSTAKGFEKRYNCQKQSGGVTVTYIYTNSGGTNIGSSITYTAFNGEDGSRHWTGAVLWNTPDGGKAASSQYKSSCDGYTVYSNLMYLSKASMTGPSSITPNSKASYTVTVTNPDGGTSPVGTVALFQQLGSSPSPAGKNCDGTPTSGTDPAVASAALSGGKATLTTQTLATAGTYKYYAAYTGTPTTSSGLASYCLTPPQSGLTGSQTATATLTVATTTASAVTAESTVRQQGTARSHAAATKDPRLDVLDLATEAPEPLTVRCPSGQAPLQNTVGSPTKVLKPDMVHSVRGGIRITTDSLPDGTDVTAQVVCRPANAKAMRIGAMAYGTTKADRFTSNKEKANLLGGLKGDRLTLLAKNGRAYGGPGPDRISLRKAGAASGGPGADRMMAGNGTALLNGGTGPDRLIGGPGTTLLNAKDQAPDDVVVCTGKHNYVKADSGDHLVGPCKKASAYN